MPRPARRAPSGASDPLDARLRRELVRDVRRGLGREGQKELSCTYLYDAVGSALFDAIGRLPEYGLTRASERLLAAHAEEHAAAAGTPALVAELGSGSGRTTRAVLEAAARRGPVAYRPIDLSPAALEGCVRALSDLGGVRVDPVRARYLDGLDAVVGARPRGRRLLLLFLGSTIGNFDREGAVGFLGDVRRRLEPGDLLSLGADLETDPARLVPAYDDPAGVTAAFDRNLLARLNRELGGDFDLRRFRHRARWDARARRVEMHLVSTAEQTVSIRAAGLRVRLARGETIWTESSHKFEGAEVVAMGERAGWRCRKQWIDEEWPFAQTLFAAG